jgi:hypothetical protein
MRTKKVIYREKWRNKKSQVTWRLEKNEGNPKSWEAVLKLDEGRSTGIIWRASSGIGSAPLADIRILASGLPTSKATPSLEAKEVCIAITPSNRGGDDPTWTSMEVWEGELARTPSGAGF